MATGHEKLTSTVVPVSPIPEVQESIRTVIIFCILVAVWTALRLYARRVRVTPLNVEDTLIFISVACFYAMVVCFFVLLYLGAIGYHMDQLQKRHVARLTQTMLVMQALYGLAMCTSKWSILWLLKHIFDIPWFRMAAWTVMVVQAGWVVMTVLIGLLVCSPIEKNWDPTAKGHCGDQKAAYTAVSVVNVVVDVTMCILPLPAIWSLQVKKPYKMALFGIFGISVVAIIFAILRLLSLRDIDFGDFSYTIPTAITWTYAEMGVIILVACSPMLRPLFDQLFKRFLSNIGRSGGSGPYALSQNTNNTNNNNNNPNDFDGRPVRRRAAHDGSEDSLGLYATSTSDVHGEARATGGKDAGSDSKSDKDGGTAVTTVPMV